jgi:spore coat protein H
MLRSRFRVVVAAAALVMVTPHATRAQGIPPPVPLPTPAADPSDAFFDDTVVHTINLTISSRDWDSLRIHYLDNTDYPCDFRWRDQVKRNIAIRSRGTGSRSGVKPGLRVDFNYYSAGQTFLGLKSLVLRNNTQDPSNLRERIGMLFFRRMGLKAEREAHARLFINNNYAGLYTLVESIDKNFLKDNFGENDGHLYEYKFDNSAETPFNFSYLGDDPALYTPLPFKPQTLESDPQGEVIARLFWTINVAGDAVWRTAMEEFLDLKKFIRHLAVQNFLAEEDGLTGDYGPNNFYFYRFERKNLFTFIAWDMSNTFWEGPAYSVFRNIDGGDETHRNRLVIRALKDTELRELYLDTLLECADSAVEDSWLEAEVLNDAAQIRPAVVLDTFKITSTDDFDKAIEDMALFARQRSDFVRQQVAADRDRRGRR